MEQPQLKNLRMFIELGNVFHRILPLKRLVLVFVEGRVRILPVLPVLSSGNANLGDVQLVPFGKAQKHHNLK